MCCPTTHPPVRHFPMAMPVADCGCGCIGKDRIGWYLKNYREHLKAELASVEEQIQAVQKIKS